MVGNWHNMAATVLELTKHHILLYNVLLVLTQIIGNQYYPQDHDVQIYK